MMSDIERKLGYFDIWYATLPADMVELKNVQIKLYGKPKNYLNHALIVLHLYDEFAGTDKEYQSDSTIMTANGEFYIHPGTNRYLLERVCKEMPKSKVLIINRWGTTYEQVLKSFPDAKLYKENVMCAMNYKEKPHKLVAAHGMKCGWEGHKDTWLIHVKEHLQTQVHNGITRVIHPVFNTTNTSLSIYFQDQCKIILGPQSETTRLDITVMEEFTIGVLKHFRGYVSDYIV